MYLEPPYKLRTIKLFYVTSSLDLLVILYYDTVL